MLGSDIKMIEVTTFKGDKCDYSPRFRMHSHVNRIVYKNSLAKIFSVLLNAMKYWEIWQKMKARSSEKFGNLRRLFR